mmetsp:Transcript_3467/g.8467  ORF Transcript_3467/g.8467 Transcript_3467/m.8467 type:complete len:296 (+) Transcript_3467:337-1224(+)
MRSLCCGVTSLVASSCWRMEERMREDLSTLSIGLTLSAITVSRSDLSNRCAAGNTTCSEQASMRRLPERESASRRSNALSLSLLCSSSSNVSISGAASRFLCVRFFQLLSGLRIHALISPCSSISSMHLSRATGMLVTSSSPSCPSSGRSSPLKLLSSAACCGLLLLLLTPPASAGIGFGGALLLCFFISVFSLHSITSIVCEATRAPGAHILRMHGAATGGGGGIAKEQGAAKPSIIVRCSIAMSASMTVCLSCSSCVSLITSFTLLTCCLICSTRSPAGVAGSPSKVRRSLGI